MNSKMLIEAGFRPGWFEDVEDGDTVMIEFPGTSDIVEMVVSDLRPSAMCLGARRFIGTRTDGDVGTLSLGPEYSCWILRH